MEKEKLNISCSTITLEVFLDCLFDNNLKLLSQDKTEEELKEIWEKICEEYASLTGDTKQSYIFLLSKKILLLEAKIAATNLISAVSETKKEDLKKIGYSGTELTVKSLIKRDTFKLENSRQELEAFKKAQADSPKSTRMDYMDWIISVSKYIGYGIDEKQITVAKFVAMSKMAERATKHKPNSQ